VAEVRATAARWRSTVADATAEQALQVGYFGRSRGMDPDLPFGGIVWSINRELIHHGVRDFDAAASTPDGGAPVSSPAG
jgi:hypothetical protein